MPKFHDLELGMLLCTTFLFMSANFKFQLTIFYLLWQYFRKCLKDEAERVASHSGPEINHRVAYEHVLINCASAQVSSPAGGIRLRATRSCEGPEGGLRLLVPDPGKFLLD